MAFRITLILSILLQFALLYHTFTTADPTYLDSRCSDNTVYAPNSKHQTNLNAVFHNLTSKASRATSGTTSNNNVFGLFLCRGDLTVTSCKDCVVTATLSLAQLYCPFKKAGVIWYNECMVRYTNESFSGRMEDSPKVIISNSRNITGNQSRFTGILDDVMSDMIVHTSNTSFHLNFVQITRFHTLRAFSQCTPDLTGNDCTQCLKIAVSQLPVSITGMVLQPSCNIWYEIYRSDMLSIPPSNILKNPSGKDNLLTEVIVATLVPVSSILVAVLALCLIVNRARMVKYVVRNADDDGIDIESLRYDMSTLQSATNNFSPDNLLPFYGYGACLFYKGIQSDGAEITVQRMMVRNHHDFTNMNSFNAVLSYAKLQHRNVQSFLGFCVDGDDWFLIFEYVPYTLDCVLFDPYNKNIPVDWRSRFQIIKGTARGLLYLHQDSRLTIVHRYINSRSVLLDEHMNPKISDFAVAKILPLDQPQLRDEAVYGQTEYICPGLFRSGRLSVQSDLYSFGVLILEIIRGRRFLNHFHVNNEYSLEWAREKWRDGQVIELMDETVRDSDSIDEIKRCIHLGLLCADDDPDKRPTMATVVLMLESHSVTLPKPEQPAYMSQEVSNQGEPDDTTRMLIPCSVDVASFTETGPR